MYLRLLKKRSEHMKFFAAIHGIDISGKSGEKTISKDEVPEGIDNPKEFVFGNPDAYEKMSDEEKEQLTQKMMGNWVNFTKGGLGSKE